MIRNNSITYNATESPLMIWRAEDQTLHTFLVAILTTVLAYQTTAILFDLLVGFKPKGKVAIADLGSVMVAQESSLLSAATSLLHNDILWRWRLKILKRSCPDKNRKPFVVSFPIYLKLLFLFLAAPSLTLISIVITLESDSLVSFRDAEFGGIALGVALNQNIVDYSKESTECALYQTSHTKYEETVASFHLCSLHFRLDKSTLNSTNLSISQTNSEEVLINFETEERRYRSFLKVDVRIMGQIYRLRERIALGEGTSLLRLGQEKMLESCAESSNDPAPTIRYTGSKWNISQSIPCVPEERTIIEAIESMTRLITVVNTDNFEILDIEVLKAGQNASSNVTDYRSNFIYADDLPFLRRRRSYLSFVALCIAAGCAIVIRIILKVLTNNDIDIGIESIVKDSLGMVCCDSMLQDRSIIDFHDENFVMKDGKDVFGRH